MGEGVERAGSDARQIMLRQFGGGHLLVLQQTGELLEGVLMHV